MMQKFNLNLVFLFKKKTILYVTQKLLDKYFCVVGPCCAVIR